MDSIQSLLFQDIAVLALGLCGAACWLIIWKCHKAAQQPRITTAGDGWFPVRGRWLLYAAMVVSMVISLPAIILFVVGIVSVNGQLVDKLANH